MSLACFAHYIHPHLYEFSFSFHITFSLCTHLLLGLRTLAIVTKATLNMDVQVSLGIHFLLVSTQEWFSGLMVLFLVFLCFVLIYLPTNSTQAFLSSLPQSTAFVMDFLMVMWTTLLLHVPNG